MDKFASLDPLAPSPPRHKPIHRGPPAGARSFTTSACLLLLLLLLLLLSVWVPFAQQGLNWPTRCCTATPAVPTTASSAPATFMASLFVWLLCRKAFMVGAVPPDSWPRRLCVSFPPTPMDRFCSPHPPIAVPQGPRDVFQAGRAAAQGHPHGGRPRWGRVAGSGAWWVVGAAGGVGAGGCGSECACYEPTVGTAWCCWSFQRPRESDMHGRRVARNAVW